MIDSDNPAPTPEEVPKLDIQALSQLDPKEVANTSRFQEWAGEGWQTAGEVVMNAEVPVLFYHGGHPGVTKFFTEQTPNTSPEQRGIYVTPRLNDARFYADKLKIDQQDRGLPQGSSVYAVMLKMRNPYFTEKGDGVSSASITAAPEGYDGIVNVTSQEVVVFDPAQIFIAAEAQRL